MSLAAAFASAQTTIARAMGAAGSTTPPGTWRCNGVSGTGVIRAANAFELASMDREATEHGFRDGSVMLLTATRAQFTVDPIGWRRQQMAVYAPTEKLCTVHSIATDDPHFYVFTLLFRQGAA